MRKFYLILLVTCYLILIFFNLIGPNYIENIIGKNRWIGLAIGTYAALGIIFVWFAMLIDCLHRNFVSRKAKTWWFVLLIILNFITTPIYFFTVVFPNKTVR
jgi:hypothetical protein